ncbi:MAG: acyl carrier protein [Rhodomicrobium sp.]
MNKQEILAKVGQTIASVLDQPNLRVTMRTTMDDVEGWDSFNHINIAVALESEFGLKFNASEVAGLRAVGDFVDLIEKKLAKRK